MGGNRRYRKRKFAFGSQVLALRTRAALTQGMLAEQIGVHLRSVQNWESGESYPKADTLQRLIVVLLSYRVWTPGDERAEAAALWGMAMADGPHPLPAFDDVWFLAQQAAGRETGRQGDRETGRQGDSDNPQSPTSNLQSPISNLQAVDWGESIAVPPLYGRERELATLRQWAVEDRCRVVALIGLGGIGKSSLAITLAHSVLAQFDLVLFRSLQNAPPLAEALDQIIRAVANQQTTPPDHVADKIALLVQLFRERRCLLILDNFEAILQPSALTGAYRSGYAEYGTLLERLSEREHQSCLILTSREKPTELGPLEGRSSPVRSLALAGLDERACEIILKNRDIVGTADDLRTLVQLYGGNPLACHLVTEPIRELFGGDLGAFLAAGDVFFNGLGKLMEQQCARTTPLEHAIIRWLAIERELVPVSTLLDNLGAAVSKREVLVALESLRRRVQIERGPGQPAFTLQPAILEFVTNQMIGVIGQEVVEGQPMLLHSHALIQAGAKDYLRRSQEQLIARTLLERLADSYGDTAAVERRLRELLASWRDQPLPAGSYGPGNVVNLLRLLRGNLRGLDASGLRLRGMYLQGVEMQDANLSGATIDDSRFTEIFDVIQAVAVSSSGAYWAAATRRGEIVVWEAGNLRMQRMWRAHTNMVWHIAWSPDERLLASCSWDGTVKLSDVASGTVSWSGQHTSHVNSAAFAPDGSMLASAGNDATVRLWDVRSGMQLEVLPHPGPVSGSGVSWSADGRWLASGDLAGDIRVWAIRQPAPASCVLTIPAHSSIVDGLAFSPDGSTLASASWDGTVKLWNTSALLSAGAISGDLVQNLVGHTGRTGRVAWSPDGLTLAVSGYDPSIWLWDVARGAYRATLHGHTDGVCGLAFTPDSRTLLSCGNGILRVWDAISGQAIHAMQGYEDSLSVVDWSPDGSQLISGGMDALVTIWDASGERPPRVLPGHTGSVCGVGWNPNGGWLASSEWENAIRLWDPGSGACRQVLQHPTDPGNIFYGLAWSPDGQRLACGTARHGILVWDMPAQQLHWAEQQHPTFLRLLAWSPDGALLAGGGDDGIVYIWDASTGALLQRLAGHHSMITSVAWSPDGAWLATGGRGQTAGELFMWDVARWERVDTLIGHAGVVYALAWGAPGVLISGGGDGTLCWWDAQRGARLWARAAHQGTVQALRRSPDGTRLASCGDDGAIMLWDLHSGAQLRTLRRDRPYERMAITGISGLTEAQKASLIALGAIDGNNLHLASSIAQSPISNLQSLTPNSQLPTPSQSLPLQPTPFFGRDAEMIEIARLLADPACRLLTLLGPGGIGKTRLAVEVAGRSAASFADGVTFVALTAVDTASQMISAIGEALRLSFAGQPNPTAHLLDHLSDLHMLLVLDSFEHLLTGADLVAAMLERAPQITILTTSRERLHLQAEWLFDVQGLTYPLQDIAGLTSPLDFTHYSAIQLFAQRATQIQPGFALNEPNLALIAQICRYVAGMPLAIELAVAGLRALPLALIEQQIRASLDALATTLRDVPARHRSLRAVFDHSWNLLSEPERATLSRLAVFRGGCTAAAAAAVVQRAKLRVQSSETNAADPVQSAEFKGQSAAQHDPELLTLHSQLLTHLAALVDKSLLRQTNDVEQRFVLLGSLREYALEQLAARGEVQALQRAHAGYYLALAESADWDTPAGEAQIAQLDREHDNLRAALAWCMEEQKTQDKETRGQGDKETGRQNAPPLPVSLSPLLPVSRREIGLRLAGALTKFWQRRGLAGEGRMWLEELLAFEDDSLDALAARLPAMEGAARLATHQYDFARATQLFEQSAALRRALGQVEDTAQLLGTAAIAARVAGKYTQAIALLEDALLHQRSLNDRGSLGGAGLGLSLVLLGVMRREQGDFVQARALYQESLALHRALGDREGISISLLGLGDIARDQGDLAQMRLYATESLALVRELQVHWAVGVVLNILALAALLEGDLPHAFAISSESVALLRAQQADGVLAEVLLTLSRIEHAQGDAAAAYQSLTVALGLAAAVGPRLMVAAALEAIAQLIVAQEQATLATQLLATAAALRSQMGTPVRPVDQAAMEQALASARSALGDAAFAAAWAEAQARPLEQIMSSLPSTAAFAALH